MPGVLPAAFILGQRLQVDKHKATVLFIGAVDGQFGTWIGLEWDEVTRGKHDGSHCGKRYDAVSFTFPGSGPRVSSTNNRFSIDCRSLV